MGVVKAVLQEARARGLRLGVASGGQRDVVDKVLADFGLQVMPSLLVVLLVVAP